MSNPIQWFPGHMSSALKMISAELKLCDVIIYMLDARCPVSCLNPKFDELVMRRPVLFVLNKADLAPSFQASKFEIQSKNVKCEVLSLNSAQSGAGKNVVYALERLLKEKVDTAKQKGITKTVRAIVIGVTNCGKSTFINNLAGRGKTLTGDRPGVTRTKQWVPVNDNFLLLDTPGTLWPAFLNPQVAKNLAYVGSIKDDVLNIVDVSKELLADLQKLDPECLNRRFKIETCDGEDVFKQICHKRGYVLKGGILDEERAAKAILTEFRAGKIGRFNFDSLLGNKLTPNL